MSIAHKFKDKLRTDDVIISESVDFSSLLLSKPVLKGLTDAGFQKPSPIQLKAIPLGRCGLDLIVQAKSGTGKTCVFTVVALESLELSPVCIQVLVLAPTREIAQQIQEVIKTIGLPMAGLKCHTFIGGMPVLQDKILAKNCHIAVGTPGRIKQLIEIDAIKTNSIRLFILDEADKLLEGDFQEPINWIYSSLPENKQILALSATYPEYLARQLTSYMRNPTFVRLNVTDPALLGIKQYHVVVPNHPMPNIVFNSKTEVVVKILSTVSFQQCLIFSNLQTRAQNLQSELQSRNWPTACIAGCLDQKERNFAMEQLKTYKCRILISTDLTSRGIDADKVNLVINLDVPTDAETYLHRIGRAGRFGSFGAAVTIVTSEGQDKVLWAIEKKCKTCIHKLPDPIPKDLVTKSLPLRLDDIVVTEQIMTHPLSNTIVDGTPSVVTQCERTAQILSSDCVDGTPSVVTQCERTAQLLSSDCVDGMPSVVTQCERTAQILSSDCVDGMPSVVTKCERTAQILSSDCVDGMPSVVTQCERTAQILSSDCVDGMPSVVTQCERTAQILSSDCVDGTPSVVTKCERTAQILSSDCTTVAGQQCNGNADVCTFYVDREVTPQNSADINTLTASLTPIQGHTSEARTNTNTVESLQPIVAELSETPVVVESEPPVVVESEPPVVVGSETPVVVGSETPVAVESETPVVVESETPVVEELSEMPVVVESEAPVVAESETPVVAESEPPVVAESEPPVVVESETPVVVESETPVVVESETPVVAQSLSSDRRNDTEQSESAQLTRKKNALSQVKCVTAFIENMSQVILTEVVEMNSEAVNHNTETGLVSDSTEAGLVSDSTEAGLVSDSTEAGLVSDSTEEGLLINHHKSPVDRVSAAGIVVLVQETQVLRRRASTECGGETQVTEGGTECGGETQVREGGTECGGETQVTEGGTECGGETQVTEGGTECGGETQVREGGTECGGETQVTEGGTECGGETQVREGGTECGGETQVTEAGTECGGETQVREGEISCNLAPDGLVPKARAKPRQRRGAPRSFAVSDFLHCMNEGLSSFRTMDLGGGGDRIEKMDTVGAGRAPGLAPGAGGSEDSPAACSGNGAGACSLLERTEASLKTACEADVLMETDLISLVSSVGPSKADTNDLTVSPVGPSKADTNDLTVSPVGPSKADTNDLTVSPVGPSKADTNDLTVSPVGPSKADTNDLTVSPVGPSKADTNDLTVSPSVSDHVWATLNVLLSQGRSPMSTFDEVVDDYTQFCASYLTKDDACATFEVGKSLEKDEILEGPGYQDLCHFYSGKLARIKSEFEEKLTMAHHNSQVKDQVTTQMCVAKETAAANGHVSVATADDNHKPNRQKRKGSRCNHERGADSLNWRKRNEDGCHTERSATLDPHTLDPRTAGGHKSQLSRGAVKKHGHNAGGTREPMDLRAGGTQEPMDLRAGGTREPMDLRAGGAREVRAVRMRDPRAESNEEVRQLDEMHAAMLQKRRERKKLQLKNQQGICLQPKDHQEGTNLQLKDHQSTQLQLKDQEGTKLQLKDQDTQLQLKDHTEGTKLQLKDHQEGTKLQLKDQESTYLQLKDHQGTKLQLKDPEAVYPQLVDEDREVSNCVQDLQGHMDETDQCILTKPQEKKSSAGKFTQVRLINVLDVKKNPAKEVDCLESKVSASTTEISQLENSRKMDRVKLKEQPKDVKLMLAQRITAVDPHNPTRARHGYRVKKVKPIKPSKSDARLAGLVVSDGSTSSTSSYMTLSSTSDVTDASDRENTIFKSHCYANKYADEGHHIKDDKTSPVKHLYSPRPDQSSTETFSCYRGCSITQSSHISSAHYPRPQPLDYLGGGSTLPHTPALWQQSKHGSKVKKLSKTREKPSNRQQDRLAPKRWRSKIEEHKFELSSGNQSEMDPSVAHQQGSGSQSRFIQEQNHLSNPYVFNHSLTGPMPPTLGHCCPFYFQSHLPHAAMVPPPFYNYPPTYQHSHYQASVMQLQYLRIMTQALSHLHRHYHTKEE
ncbi:uncharacterized protein LOC131937218 [Physella acuta]|uniref:uncharacterized protein LOC131937218 n=1 Tax=Physella acuta TaxID=109671 RepID=UPI0027DC9442|nr:uncharacterized protein LOC131937218 [Physella acuta]